MVLPNTKGFEAQNTFAMIGKSTNEIRTQNPISRKREEDEWKMTCPTSHTVKFTSIIPHNFGVWLFYGTQFFSKKSAKSSIHFWTFKKKIYGCRFKMVPNGKILKNFDEIAYKTPHRPFLETFRNFLKPWTRSMTFSLHEWLASWLPNSLHSSD